MIFANSHLNLISPLPRARGDQTVTIRAGDVHNALHLAQAHAAVTAALGAFKYRDLAKVELLKREGPEAGANVFFTFGLAAGATSTEFIASASRPTTIQPATPYAAVSHPIRSRS